MVLFFTHIPFVVNHTIKATPLERFQLYQHAYYLGSVYFAARMAAAKGLVERK